MAKQKKIKRKGKKKRAKRPTSKKWALYEIKDGKLIRKNKFCPRCGPGVFLANHGDRLSCGKCGYTEFISKPSK